LCDSSHLEEGTFFCYFFQKANLFSDEEKRKKNECCENEISFKALEKDVYIIWNSDRWMDGMEWMSMLRLQHIYDENFFAFSIKFFSLFPSKCLYNPKHIDILVEEIVVVVFVVVGAFLQLLTFRFETIFSHIHSALDRSKHTHTHMEEAVSENVNAIRVE